MYKRMPYISANIYNFHNIFLLSLDNTFVIYMHAHIKNPGVNTKTR